MGRKKKHKMALHNQRRELESYQRKEHLGSSKRNKNKMIIVREGDLMVFYVKPLRLGGVLEVSSQPYKDFEEIFSSLGFFRDEMFPYHVRIKPVLIPKRHADSKPLIPKLKFVASKESRALGGYFFGKTMMAISLEDYKILKLTLKG